MTIEFAPAIRSAEKARIALAGPAGSGKTYRPPAFSPQSHHVYADGSS